MKKLIKRAVVVVLFLALGAGSGYLAYKYLNILRLIQAPDITGKSVEEAHKILKDEGLKLVLAGRAFDPGVPSGHVLTQAPNPGEKIYQREEVKVVLSEGPPVGLMPDITRMTLAEAGVLLQAKGLSIERVIKVHSDIIEKDLIIAQSPAPMGKIDRAVSVVVSVGGHDVIYYTPDFTGMGEEEARSLAEKLGLLPVVEGRSPEGTGTVLEQSPAPGARVRKGQEIQLILGEDEEGN